MPNPFINDLFRLADDAIISIESAPNYSSEAVGNSDAVVNLMKAIQIAYKKMGKPSVIIGSGNSGLGIGSITSYLARVPFIHLRNTMDTRSTSVMSPGDRKNKKAVPNRTPLSLDTFWFVDDLLDSGKTLTRCLYTMYEYNPKSVCTGVILATGNISGHEKLVTPVLTAQSFVIHKDYNKLAHEIVYGDGTKEVV